MFSSRLCLFKRHFKVMNNSIFVSEISYLFSRDIQVFVQKMMTPKKLSQYKDKSQNQECLGKYWSDAAQTWHH